MHRPRQPPDRELARNGSPHCGVGLQGRRDRPGRRCSGLGPCRLAMQRELGPSDTGAVARMRLIERMQHVALDDTPPWT